jgi:hypothetical protein
MDWSELSNEDLQRSYDEAMITLDRTPSSEKWAAREILAAHRDEAKRRGIRLT